jgi:hypothetical protein
VPGLDCDRDSVRDGESLELVASVGKSVTTDPDLPARPHELDAIGPRLGAHQAIPAARFLNRRRGIGPCQRCLPTQILSAQAHKCTRVSRGRLERTFVSCSVS